MDKRSDDKRTVGRVQFFELDREQGFSPTWIFGPAPKGGHLGLIVDASARGLQILTDKYAPLEARQYQVVLRHADSGESLGEPLDVDLRWSTEEGTLYQRNGFSVHESEAPALKAALAGQGLGRRWVQCELRAT